MMLTLSSYPELKGELISVREKILEAVSATSEDIKVPLMALIEGNGKMLRPAFLILSSHFGNFERERVVSLSAAVEMLHMATLVHDDMIDNSPVRRGRPTLHTLHGEKNAVIMGDFLFSRAFRMAASYSEKENALNLAQVVSRICEGEIRQNTGRYDAGIGVREYRRRIMGKTALLFSLCCHIGARESSCDPEVAMRLRRFGYNIGMGFQIIDDILDFTGTEEAIGKPVGADVRDGVYTLPLLYALEKDSGGLRRELAGRPASKRGIRRIIRKTEDLEGIKRARQDAAQYTERALRECGLLPQSGFRDALEETAQKLLLRTY